MIKRINVDQLKTGMFVHDFNCGWMKHPFFSTSTKVKSERIIEKILSCGIKELYIDTERGLDVADAPTEAEVKEEIRKEITNVIKTEKGKRNNAPIREEIVRAREIKREAKKTIHELMDDIRFGKQIKTEKVEHVVEKMVASIFRNQDALVSLGMIKQVHEYTYMHSMSVCALMISFCRHLGYDGVRLMEAGIGAILHDVGKMKVPIEILTNDKGLTEEDFAIMKKHVVFSRAILEETQGIPEASILLAAQHHERVDGTGYPNGLKKDDITKLGQAVSIVDVYDAMTSKRAYQRKYDPTDVLGKLYEWSKHHYNRDLVQQFIICMGIYPVGTLVRLESGYLAIILDQGRKSLLHPVVRVIYDSKKKRYIHPRDIDLSEPRGGSEDRIVNYEPPDKWDISPELYVN